MVALPRLRVRTARIADPGGLLQLAPVPGAGQLRELAVWLRRGDGIVGRGEVWRAEFSGPDRIREAREAWQQLVEASEISDEVQLPSTGLVAFGAFAFADSSEAASVLRVPELIFGRRGGVAFVTRVTLASVDDPEDESEPVLATAQLPVLAPIGEFAPLTFTEGAMTAELHHDAVAEAVARIRAGELSKVVIARDLEAPIAAGQDFRAVLARLAEAYPETWTYAVDGLIGASPEMLVRVIDGAVTARVLAGTAPREADAGADADAAEALRASAKNREEHRYAVESALGSLRSLDRHDEPDTGLTSSPEPFLLELPNVWHLASDIRGTLPRDASVLDLVAALHPTAAVGGTPREAALAAIDKLEPFDRMRYAGPAGWLSASGDGEWVVALRGAEFATDAVTAFAGGGIVGSSDPDEEFAETLPKFRPIVEALGATVGPEGY
ncbi:isochorismate synthase [Gulosibacter sediminis]|uniref:isochorismate synthase n=1 Tax=Gulosibacter sediminis TaxID=1729695 RepID=UPI0024A854F2|nr:chorismate-binding protein [Gulosibacter sediminis]